MSRETTRTAGEVSGDGDVQAGRLAPVENVERADPDRQLTQPAGPAGDDLGAGDVGAGRVQVDPQGPEAGGLGLHLLERCLAELSNIPPRDADHQEPRSGPPEEENAVVVREQGGPVLQQLSSHHDRTGA